ncbi:Uncharacterised protein [Candidatus Bilamarchaeum dharawalense]|uniref:Uncharacterized protein n=1 Tax=Candidatus Bilamarchaeum dharawalense TaxID=2885759 RepID=A0A5E4LSB7_9ARCH|nr:Uncharacterised protein [Candidatus Bilamarchaeum dharawalense]
MKKLRALELREAASDRLRVIQPICEDMLGRRLVRPIEVRIHSKPTTNFLVDFWYPIKTSLSRQQSAFSPEYGTLSRSATVVATPFLFAVRSIYSLFPGFGAINGYAVTGVNVILVLAKAPLTPNTPNFDYFLAHETIHLLTPDLEVVPKGRGEMLYEGVATYYGEKVARILHPGFEVLRTSEERPVYIFGYHFVKSVAEKTGQDPLMCMIRNPPLSTEHLEPYLARL